MPDVHSFWQITLGNILTITGGVVTLAALWWRTAQDAQRMKDKVETLVLRQTRSEAELEQIAKMGLITIINQHERRLSDAERALSDVHEMRTDIRWIKQELEKRSAHN